MTDSERAIDEQLKRSETDGHTPGADQARTPGASAPGGKAKPSEVDGGRALDADGSANGGVAEIEEDLDELVAVAAQRDEYLALAQRTQADFENYRKRVARESALAQERGVAKLAVELLPAIDNLDRALQSAAQDDPLLDGVRLVRQELSAALARVGVEAFSPLGESFDPAMHEAMATTQQGADGAASGTVVEVYQSGYRLGENILRPARVVVAA